MVVVKDANGTVVYWQSVSKALANPTTALNGAVGSTKTTSVSFTLPSTLTDGTYTLEYYRKDGGSTGTGDATDLILTGWSADGTSTFKVDASVSQNILTNPLDPNSLDVDYLVNDTRLLTGQTEADATKVVISIVVNGVTKTATLTSSGGNPPLKADGSWSYTVPSNWGMVDGFPYTATIVATDAAGNIRTDSFLLSVDTTPPTPPSVNEFTFTTPDSKWKHDIGALGIVGDVSGTAESNSEIRIYTLNGQKKENNQTVFADGYGKWTWTPKLDTDADGAADATISLDTLYSPIKFVLDSIDAAGNVSKTVDVLLGANAVELGDNPATGPVQGDNLETEEVETDFVLDDGIETDFVLNNINDALTGTINDDLIIGYAGDDFLNGRAGNDVLYGGTGRDHLVGGDGNDEMAGGTQADLLDGGGGADRFIYSRFNESSLSERDSIINFSGTDQDVIDVSELCRALGITNGTFNANYTFGSSGTDATTTKVKGKTVTAGFTAGKGDFWLGNDGVLYGNLDDRTGAEFAVALVTPTLDAENNVIGYTPSTDVAGMRTYLSGAGLNFTV